MDFPLFNSFTQARRSLGGAGDNFTSDEFGGVHVEYNDLWMSMVFLSLIWIVGFLGEKILFMPALVGQIFAGIIFGPPFIDIVPKPEAFVLLGEIGLVLLVIEAGVDIDVMTLKLIGKRGVIIAILGSIFPILIGLALALAMGYETKEAIGAGCAFAPTSLGIAMNILRTGKIINTPTGQLIVAAAIIDDMIALILLSQLNGLAGTITAWGVLSPIVSALCFLCVGGYLALFHIPRWLDKFVFKEGMDSKTHGNLALAIMLALVVGMMQATHFTKSSHLMGAFIAGLVFCTDHELHVNFVSQFKRILQWLMRIFFASTIGFQVPIQNFGQGKVLWQGFVFTLALLGKLCVGFLVPNFSQSRKFSGMHLRDCLIVGCSMAAEGEFAFVIAAFAFDAKLIDKDLYSSVVLAILMSTVIAPFSLRFTISYFNKRSMEEIENAELLLAKSGDVEGQLIDSILEGSTVFYCVNTTSHGAWGTLPKLMKCLFDLQLEVIDHRSWHSRYEDTAINEVYVKGEVKVGTDVDAHIQQIFDGVSAAINQSDAVISVSRWQPGVIDDMQHGSEAIQSANAVSEKLVEEARKKLNQSVMKAEEKDKFLTSMEKRNEDQAARPRRRVRIVSTPAGGHRDMFAEPGHPTPILETVPMPTSFQPSESILPRRRRMRALSTPLSGDMFGDTSPVVLAPGEVLVHVIDNNGTKYPVKMDSAVLDKIRNATTPLSLMEVQSENSLTGVFLDGFVRRPGKLRSNSMDK